MAWLSPAFPVGGFSYSHGLERAAHDGMLPDATALREWLCALVAFGSGWNDAVLFAEAHAARPRIDGATSSNSPSLPRRLPAREERHREIHAAGRGLRRGGTRLAASGLRTPALRLPLLRRRRRDLGAHGVAT